MGESKKSIEQKTRDVNGDVISPIVATEKMRDLTINKTENVYPQKGKEFDVSIDTTENFIINFARFLLSHLGSKKFLAIVLTLVLGSGGTLAYDFYMSTQNITFSVGNSYQIVIAIIVFAVFSSMGLMGLQSKCTACNSLYATVPTKRTVVNSGKYDGYIHHTIQEVRKCKICNNISYRKYIEREAIS